MKKISQLFLCVCIVIALLLVMCVAKGDKGNPIAFQTNLDTKVLGPFELTNSNSRYALIISLVENKTVVLTDSLARFAAPDLIRSNGKYFTVFTPGVSFIAMPLYALGKYVGLPQLFTYATTLIFALINMGLVVLLARRLGARTRAALMSGWIFLFSTNALPYALTLTQHHLSIMLLLLAALVAFRKRTIVSNVALGLLFGAGLLADIPNAFMMAPLLLYAGLQHITSTQSGSSVRLTVQLNIVTIAIGLLPMLGLIGWYNYQTTGSYTKLAQFAGRVDYPDPNKPEKVAVKKEKDPYAAHLPFYPRLQANGLSLLLFSNERGWFYYMPIVAIGMIGLIISYRRHRSRSYVVALSAVIFMIIMMYSMWGDPWGGWAYGPRYLLPATAIVCAGIGVAIDRFRRNIAFIAVFFVLVLYSTWVSTIGSFTTNAIPPKQEAEHLITPIPYTYEYNLGFIQKNQSSSLVYNLFLVGRVPLTTILILYQGVVFAVLIPLYLLILLEKRAIDDTA